MKALSLILCLTPAFAQSFSVGLKGGVPLTDAFATARQDSLSFSSVTGRYTVGPTAEIGLPLVGFSVEADALYRRIGWDSRQTGTALLEPYQSTARIGAWDFAALLKRRVGGPGVHFYAGAGAAFRRFFTTRETYVFPSPHNISNQMIGEVSRKNIPGVVASLGLEVGAGVRFAPEFRYTRWLSNNIAGGFGNYLSTQANQAEALLSITFGH